MDEKKNYLFDRDGRKLTVRELDALLRDDNYRQVALTKVGDVEVSTVWTGICSASALGYMQARRVFETMAFYEGLGSVSEPVRTVTEEQAREAHEAMCLAVKMNGGLS